MKPKLSIDEVREMARALRKDSLIQIYNAKSGHPGGPLSAADYLAVLWFRHLRIDSENPAWEDRDRFVMSNGHCSALNYALLCRQGFIPQDELLTFREAGSRLQGHPNYRKIPGLEASTGSLGQGLPVAHGMALGAKLAKRSDVRIFVNVGDGELQEGTMWEAIMAAAHYKSDNLIAMVDFNNAQIDGFVSDVMGIEPLDKKFESFGWRVINCNGHDLEEIDKAFTDAQKPDGRPTVIIFKTKMMYGTPSFEDNPGWHGKPLNADEMKTALGELGYEITLEDAVEEYRQNKA